jgi:flagellar basal-body rod protein FlgC
MNAAEISRTGLDVEWRRLEIISQNLANLGSAATTPEEAYKALRLQSGPAQSFSQALREGSATAAINVAGGVQVYTTEPSGAGARMVHEPNNPIADANGFVAYPNISHAGEMALMVQTARSYEANLVALNSALKMYAKGAEIGKR